MDTSNVNLEKVGNSLKSILFIGGIIWAIAGFYYTTDFGKKAFVEEQEVRRNADEALYDRITKTTQRNADWNLKQDDAIQVLKEELIELRIKEAAYYEREKFTNYRIKHLEEEINK